MQRTKRKRECGVCFGEREEVGCVCVSERESVFTVQQFGWVRERETRRPLLTLCVRVCEEVINTYTCTNYSDIIKWFNVLDLEEELAVIMQFCFFAAKIPRVLAAWTVSPWRNCNSPAISREIDKFVAIQVAQIQPLADPIKLFFFTNKDFLRFLLLS